MRLDGTEAFFQNPQTKFSLNGVEKPLQGFSFSPKRYYIPTSDASRPQIYVVTTDALPANAPTILPPGVTVIAPQDPAMKYKIKFGTEEHEVASMELYDESGLQATTLDTAQPAALTQDKMMGYYRLFFGAEGLRLLGLHSQAGTSITVEHRGWYQLGFGGTGYAYQYRPGNLPPLIGIYDDVDPITAATYLYDSLRDSIGSNSTINSLLVNYYLDSGDAATKLALARQNFIGLMATSAETAGEAAKIVVSVVNDGADFVITCGDYRDGKAGLGAVMMSALPFVTGQSGKFILKKGNETLLELSETGKHAAEDVFAIIRNAPRRLNSLDYVTRGKIIKTCVDNVASGKWTEEQMRLILKETKEANPNKLFVIKGVNAENRARAILRESLPAAGKLKPAGTGLTYEANHYLPVQFDEFFLRYGFDINSAEYGEWIEVTKHRRYHNPGIEIAGQSGVVKFNDYWKVFIENPPSGGFTRQLILDKLNQSKIYYPYP